MTTNNPPLAGGWKPSQLMVRILSGFVMLGAVIGLVFLGIWGVYLLVLILGGLALWEFNGLSEGMGSRAPAWLLYPLGLFFAFSGTVLKQVDVTLVLALTLVGGLGAFLFVPGRRQGLSRWAMGLAGALYVGMPFNYYLLLYTSKPNGLVWTLFTIFAVVASDAAALLIGSRIGRHPFFASISPKKTLEGAIAGVAGSVLVMLIGVSAVLGINPFHAIALGVLVGASAQVGDLVESQMKRLAEVKDSSHLIPGHGGVLDRIDSILFPPILVYLYVMVFHLL
ncbi:MAG: phosphatidate cytidylyltransferase [Chloroflexi bacterium]|nr:MAG: phosphatidate cytidylyltransferase [Chloroflexota bacterium]TMG22354.1 MAG: phosphatidate cytidylyltransferase [Chloroflexota bacterium]TMG65932.1 MAG: phosphatidate cytidylyltransferase [Chloroflexota bacterium]